MPGIHEKAHELRPPDKLAKTLSTEEKAMLEAAKLGKIDLNTATSKLGKDATPRRCCRSERRTGR